MPARQHRAGHHRRPHPGRAHSHPGPRHHRPGHRHQHPQQPRPGPGRPLPPRRLPQAALPLASPRARLTRRRHPHHPQRPPRHLRRPGLPRRKQQRPPGPHLLRPPARGNGLLQQRPPRLRPAQLRHRRVPGVWGCHANLVRAAVLLRQGKAFFFEKKKQKTFASPRSVSVRVSSGSTRVLQMRMFLRRPALAASPFGRSHQGGLPETGTKACVAERGMATRGDLG